ncbi:MAG TPA: hypothetical protein VFU86_02145 [Terriglobales bacterium]|nr:hypothetical protein [Terriglobales bacterium]
MAVSKNTCESDKDTNQLLQHFFRNSQVSSERERAWKDAVRHAGTRPSPLRFPVYEVLYSLNVQAQKMVELLEDITGRFALNRDTSRYHQSPIQYIRAEVSRDLVESMALVEHTESWLFEGLRRAEEKKLFDPDKVYLEVREREAERARQGLPPLIKFLSTEPNAKQRNIRTSVKHNRSG